MKLVINYDLINEIKKANTGINFKRFYIKQGIYTGTMIAVNLSSFIARHELVPSTIYFGIPYGLFVFGSSEFLSRNLNKREADFKISQLASSLSKINIYTDAESLKNAELYKTQYKLVRDKKIAIQENKFMMIPTNSTLNADKISLQQEHVIGSDEYVLSIGEPKRSENKVLSKAMYRQGI